MSLGDLKGKNGMSLASLADFFLEQSLEAGARAIVIVISPPTLNAPNPYSIVTNVGKNALPGAFEAIAREFRISQEETKLKEPS